MWIKYIGKYGRVEEVNDAYGQRLIEQGKAVVCEPVAEEKPKAQKAKKAEEPKEKTEAPTEE